MNATPPPAGGQGRPSVRRLAVILVPVIAVLALAGALFFALAGGTNPNRAGGYRSTPQPAQQFGGQPQPGPTDRGQRASFIPGPTATP